MTTMTQMELDALISGVLNTGITHDLIPAETATLMRARLDSLLGPADGGNEHDWDGCLMCAVRELSEGRPKDWAMDPARQPGDSVTGVVLRQGEQPSHYEARVSYLDLWLGGVERVRVAGHGMSLREALLASESQVGDTVTVLFVGPQDFTQKDTGEARTFKKYDVEVNRGHH